MNPLSQIENKKQPIVIIGNGGREAALFYHFQKFGHRVLLCPDNPAIAQDHIKNLTKFSELSLIEKSDFIANLKPSLVIIGPEQPLVDGIVDHLETLNIPVFGPNKAAARLEGSKIWMKEICRQAQIPTAQLVDSLSPIIEESSTQKYVLKKDGLASGKGVYICDNPQVLEEKIQQLKNNKEEFFIEEYIEGEEISVFALSDGENVQILPICKDYKKLYDGDKGPNTGGMGSICGWQTETEFLTLCKTFKEEIFSPLLKTLNQNNIIYRGVLFAGLIFDNKAQKYKVLEFNCRFGDPETQSLIFGLEDSLEPFIRKIAHHEKLPTKQISWSIKPSCTVVCAAENYPFKNSQPQQIYYPTTLQSDEKIFFAAVRKNESGDLFSSGGRILSTTAKAETIGHAQENAYDLVKQIKFQGMHFRTDIGAKIFYSS